MRLTLVFVMAALLARADPPQAVLELFRSAAEALANRDASAFLDLCDHAAPDYPALRDEIQALLGPDQEVSSSIEIVSDEGDDRKREMELDWVLKVGMDQTKRAILKGRVERQGRKWKIEALRPVEFFRP